jgi:isopenicillin-N N-acyltransferase-like protein
VSAFPRIRVSGMARERGRQIGQQAAARIARSIEIYRGVFAYYAGWDWQQVTEHAARYRPAIAAYEPRYLEEIDGIAEGAGLDPLDVLAINVRTEVMFAAVACKAATECTAFVALPEATADGHTLLGQNWDWKPGMSETVIVLEVEQADGPNFVTVVEAGLLAKAGLNSAGVGVVTNALVTDQDQGAPGVPYHVVLRGILDAETLSDALGAILRQPRSSAANYLLAHRDGMAVNVETAPGDYARAYMDFPGEDGTFAHTNHFACSAFDLKDVSLWNGPSSPFRLRRMQQFLRRDRGAISPQAAQVYLSDHFDYPSAICRHPDPREEPAEHYTTVASLIMDLNTATLWLADGNPCETPFRELDYAGLLDKAPSFMAPVSQPGGGR